MKKQLNRLICAVCAAVMLSMTAQAAPKMLIPGGSAVGIRLQTKGIMVTGFEEGSAAKAAGMKKGDIITQVDGRQIKTVQALQECLDSKEVAITVLRDGKEEAFSITPKSGRLGTYVRDSVAGIGTITYYDPLTGEFGALGHGVSEMDSAALIPVEQGELIDASVMEVQKGKSGTPGELKGQFDPQDILGGVEKNCAYGLFGTLTVPIASKPLPVGTAADVEPGKATIVSTISGSDAKEYDVEILRVYPHANDTGRNLLLKVTDKELLNRTGGIVQGMSGSPIIQNGKLIGAVTHVLVNDPTRGYGIFIENMLDAAE